MSDQSTLSRLTDDDLYLFNEGSHFALYEKLGAHPTQRDGESGTYFAVWAPNARAVSVIGDFNGWKIKTNPLTMRGASGIWEGFIRNVGVGAHYKYYIESRFNGYNVAKADPFGFWHEEPPDTASVVWDLAYEWDDDEWVQQGRAQDNALTTAVATYEVHLGSWLRLPEEEDRWLSYSEIAPRLADHVQRLGFTSIELMPITEHPFYGSWGYQTTGYFAPTSRYGTPQEFKYFVDYMHQRGIGVILDWVPSHFPTDEHGLAYFDGTHLFEHADRRQGFHPDWSSYIFNYGRNEVRSFLISSAMFWLDEYHIDGLRVDAVASMLYLDYSRKEGEWIPNEFGGRENLDAISFLRRFNEEVYRRCPAAQTIAEESTAWPMVSRPTYIGGLGFGMKWDMGWMHDTLRYMSKEPVYRKFHHNDLTFRSIYAFTENFVLPLSHDEVVHGKGSLVGKMPGDEWQKFANMRLLYGLMFAQPGKKLLFMGGEFGQTREWNHDRSLDWHLLQFPPHAGLQQWLADVAGLYRANPALHDRDFQPHGFEWVDANDTEGGTLSFIRKSQDPNEMILALFNFTPVPRTNFRIGVPVNGFWRELLNSDAEVYFGSGLGNLGGVRSTPIPYHGRLHSLNLTVPPLGVIFLKLDPDQTDDMEEKEEEEEEEDEE